MDLLLLAADVTESNLLAARMQMALTLGVHIILACFGVGLPVLMLAAEGIYLRTGERDWLVLAQRWARVFAVLFAVGAVSGTVLSFELGLLWPEFMARFGAVIGLPFTLEGIAFFIEAIFVGIYLYGWDRVPPRVHWLAGVPIAVSGLASAWFVVTVNAWMNAPQGYRWEEGRVVDVDPLAAMLNRATWAQTTHMILAAYLVTGFVVAAVHAAALLRGCDTSHHRRALSLALGLGVTLIPIQFGVGHWSAQVVAGTQPVKLAAMEGQFATEKSAPLRIGGWPDEVTRTTRYALEIPGGLSWLAYDDARAVVRGLDDFPRDETPPVRVVHVAFQLMIAAGSGLMAVALITGWSFWRRREIPRSRRYYWAVVACGPLVLIALETGWVVTEVGRQPWIVNGVLRTRDAVTSAPGIGAVLFGTLAIYAILTIGAGSVLRLLARVPLGGTIDGH